MTEPIDLSTNSLVAISRESLNALRASLFRDLGGNAATYLQDAGYSGAGQIYEAFENWLKTQGVESRQVIAGVAYFITDPEGNALELYTPPKS